MPTYQYACTRCDDRLEAVQSFTDAALTECPACGGRLRKVFSAVGVVFKGSGFYKNDSRSSAGSDGGGTGKDGAAKDGGSGKDGAAKDAGSGKDTGSSKDGGGGSSGKDGAKSAPAAAAAGSGSGSRSGSGSGSGSGSSGGTTATKSA